MTGPRQRVLVVGATSPVGRAISRELSHDYEVVGTHYQHPGPSTVAFDLAVDDPNALPLDWNELKAVVVAGGVTKLDACARNPEGTARVNVYGTLRLIEASQRAGASPIFLSSDTVFRGELLGGEPQPKTEADTADPATEYGRQKRAVEESILSSSGTVLRLSKLVSIRPDDGGFLFDLAGALLRGDRVRAATDQFLNLTWIDDVAEVVGLAIGDRLSGLWHVAAPPIRSRYEWTVALARALGIGFDLVHPCSLLDFDSLEVRPRDCSLDGARLQQRLPWTLRSGDRLITDVAAALASVDSGIPTD